MPHLDEETIHAWLDGEITGAEGERVERHVAECSSCAAMVAEARGMIAGAARIVSALDAVPGGVLPKPAPVVATRRRSFLERTMRVTRARAALAASLLIAAVATLATRHDRPSAAPPQSAPHATSPLATDVVAAPSVAQAANTPKEANAAQAANVPQAANPPSSIVANVRTLHGQSPARPAPAVAVAGGAPVSTPAASPVSLRDTIPALQAPPAAAAVSAEGSKSAAPKSVVNSAATADAAGVAASASQNAAQNAFAQRISRGGLALQSVVVTGAMASGKAQESSFAGCYQLGDSLAEPRGLPQRFALQTRTTDAGVSLNAVRAVSADGHMASALTASTWRAMSPTAATVEFGGDEHRATLRLDRRTDGSFAAEVQTPSGTRAISVTRSGCLP